MGRWRVAQDAGMDPRWDAARLLGQAGGRGDATGKDLEPSYGDGF